MSLPVYDKNPPSDDFVNTFASSGGIRHTCTCGRECFEDYDRAGDWEDGELGNLRQGAKESPDSVIPMDNVRICVVMGKEWVVGCPCNGMTPIEKLYWNDAKRICSYISKRSKSELEELLAKEGAAELATGGLEYAVEAQTEECCTKCRVFKMKGLVGPDGVCNSCLIKEHNVAEVLQEKEREKRRSAAWEPPF